MKNAWVIFVIVIVFAVIIWFQIIKSNISAKIDLTGINLIKFFGSFTGITHTGEIDTKIKISILNKNAFPVKINDLEVDIYYKGELIAHSLEKGNRVEIGKKTETDFEHTITINLKDAMFDLASIIVKGDAAKIDYKVKLKLYGIPVSFKDSYIFKK